MVLHRPIETTRVTGQVKYYFRFSPSQSTGVFHWVRIRITSTLCPIKPCEAEIHQKIGLINLVGFTFRPWASFTMLRRLTFRSPRSTPPI